MRIFGSLKSTETGVGYGFTERPEKLRIFGSLKSTETNEPYAAAALLLKIENFRLAEEH